MADQPVGDFIPGIDLGSNSLGWPIVGLVDGEPAQLIRAGVRFFEAGMTGTSNPDKSHRAICSDARRACHRPTSRPGHPLKSY